MSPAAAWSRAAGAGTQLWAKRYDGPAVSETDRAAAVAVSPDGGTVFITGGSGGPVVEDYATLAYDAATGTRLWVKRYNGPGKGSDQAAALAVSPDGSTVYVTGESYGGSATSSDYATVAYQTSTGTQLWARRYNGPANGADAARAVAVSSSGTTVFVTGVIAGATSQADYATVAYNASTGTQLWAKRYDSGGNGYDQANALAVSQTTGTVYVTGEGQGAGTGFDYATVAYDSATGAQRWVKRYNDPGNNTEDATAVTTNPATGAVYVTGERYGGGAAGFDYATIAYNGATGAALWVKRYDGPNHTTDQANAIAVSPGGGTVYVTGQSDTVAGSTDNDYATLAYNAATGAQQWLQRYNGPGNGNDVANAIAVDPQTGTVYVTGASAANLTSSGLDYATIAYRPTGTRKLDQPLRRHGQRQRHRLLHRSQPHHGRGVRHRGKLRRHQHKQRLRHRRLPPLSPMSRPWMSPSTYDAVISPRPAGARCVLPQRCPSPKIVDLDAKRRTLQAANTGLLACAPGRIRTCAPASGGRCSIP